MKLTPSGWSLLNYLWLDFYNGPNCRLLLWEALNAVVSETFSCEMPMIYTKQKLPSENKSHFTRHKKQSTKALSWLLFHQYSGILVNNYIGFWVPWFLVPTANETNGLLPSSEHIWKAIYSETADVQRGLKWWIHNNSPFYIIQGICRSDSIWHSETENWLST